MTIPAGHCRVSLLGHLATGIEIFDTSFWVLGGADSLQSCQALADGVATAFKANAGGFTAMLKSDSAYNSVRVYAYPSGGRNATYVAEADLSEVGDSAFTPGPLQQCAVVSLRTPQVGRSARGRMYLPACGVSVTSGSYLFNTSAIASACTDLANVFNAVNQLTIGGGNPVVSVVSLTHSSSLPVTLLTMDNKPDIQRRRANRLAGTIIATESVS